MCTLRKPHTLHFLKYKLWYTFFIFIISTNQLLSKPSATLEADSTHQHFLPFHSFRSCLYFKRAGFLTDLIKSHPRKKYKPPFRSIQHAFDRQRKTREKYCRSKESLGRRRVWIEGFFLAENGRGSRGRSKRGRLMPFALFSSPKSYDGMRVRES